MIDMTDSERRKAEARAKRIRGQENRAKAVEMRKMGATYKAIGTELGISTQAAHQAVRKAMEASKARQDADADIIKTMELENLDRLQLAAWPGAMKGNHLLIDRVLKVQERRAKLLGLDLPTKVAPTDPAGDKPYSPDEMSREERQKRIRELEAKLSGRGNPSDG